MGTIGSAPSYTPIFFSKEMDHRWGGWVGDLAPKFGWSFWFPETRPGPPVGFPEKFFQNFLAGLAAIPLGPSTLRRLFSAGNSDGTESAGGSSPMATRQVGRFWNLKPFGKIGSLTAGFGNYWEFVGESVRWALGMDQTSAFLMVWKPGMGWLIFPSLATLWVCWSLCQFKYRSINMEDVPGLSATRGS